MVAQLDEKGRCGHLGPFPPGRRLGWFPLETLAKLCRESNVIWSVS